MSETENKQPRVKLTDEQKKERAKNRRKERYANDEVYRNKQLEIIKRCHENNKEAKKAKEKEWYEAHKEERREQQKEKNKKNYEKIKLMKEKFLLIQNLSKV